MVPLKQLLRRSSTSLPVPYYYYYYFTISNDLEIDSTQEIQELDQENTEISVLARLSYCFK